jgi:hypothetical protein
MAHSGSCVMPLAALNAMDRQAFLAAFGDIAGTPLRAPEFLLLTCAALQRRANGLHYVRTRVFHLQTRFCSAFLLVSSSSSSSRSSSVVHSIALFQDACISAFQRAITQSSPDMQLAVRIACSLLFASALSIIAFPFPLAAATRASRPRWPCCHSRRHHG